MAAGVCSGFVTAFLQTRLGVESIMAVSYTHLYLPLCSLAGAVAYWKAKRGDSKKRIVGTCAVFALVPILNSAFYALNSRCV